MRRATLAAGVLALAALLPSPAGAQIFFGAHLAWTSFLDDGIGGGARIGLDLPALPIDVVASGDYFSPSCPPNADGCSLWGGSLDANLRIPFPVFRPYLTGGLSWRDGDLGGNRGSGSETGVNVGAGIDLAFVVRVFADWRYEFLDTHEGSVVRVGLLF